MVREPLRNYVPESRTSGGGPRSARYPVRGTATDASGCGCALLLTDRLREPSAPDPTARVVRAFEQRTAEVDPTLRDRREDMGPDVGG